LGKLAKAGLLGLAVLVVLVGVGWLNRTPAIKRQLMKEALGLGPLAQRL